VRSIATIAIVLLLAGCSHATIDAGSRMSTGGVAPPPGTSVTSGSAGVHVHSHSLAAVVIAGMFMAAAIDHSREPRDFPSFSSFADWFRGTPAPQLAADRPIAEQDCTKPIELTGNLKCR
jgi:hypothetical protein